MPATSSVQLPDFLALARVFSLRTNHHCHAVTSASEQAWLAPENPLLSDPERTNLRSLKIGLWAAVCFPTCDSQQLRLAMDFMTALVVCTSRLARARRMTDCGWAEDSTANELFTPILPRILSSMPSQSSRETLSALFDDFRAANARLLAFRESKTVPDINAYIELRRSLSGIPMLFSLVEMTEGLQLPSPDPHLNRLAADVISLSIDVFAYNNEQFIGNNLNLISVIQADKGVSVQGAISFAFTHIERAFKEFRALLDPVDEQGSTWNWLKPRKSPPSSPVLDNDTRLYLRGLEDCVVGTLNWSYETELYFGTKGDEVRQYGWVFIKDPTKLEEE
ncbi:isoprenoid synthase domain-containing protein [Mycena amicta]|nr:isoprenoid synthase domain-containing protein [Mycena amicta]